MGKKSNIFLAVFGMFILVIIGSSFLTDKEPTYTKTTTEMTITPIITTETRSPEGKLISSETTYGNPISNTSNDDITRYYITPYSYDPNYEPLKYRIIMELAVKNSFNAWENYNPELTFVEVYDKNQNDIVILWNDKLKSNGSDVSGLAETTEINGRFIALKGDIVIDTVDTDCNGRPIFVTQDVVEDTIKHEIGHVLGLDHSSKATHLMYADNAVGLFDSLGYVIPNRNSEFDSWISFDKLVNEHEKLQEQRDELSSIMAHNQAILDSFGNPVPYDQYDQYMKLYDEYLTYYDTDDRYYNQQLANAEKQDCFINSSD